VPSGATLGPPDQIIEQVEDGEHGLFELLQTLIDAGEIRAFLPVQYQIQLGPGVFPNPCVSAPARPRSRLVTRRVDSEIDAIFTRHLCDNVAYIFT
jgi:hypothetical protein